jgi:hypothetical protein
VLPYLAMNRTALGPDPVISALLSQVTAAKATEFLDYLTGVSSDIKTRNSIAPQGKEAAGVRS